MSSWRELKLYQNGKIVSILFVSGLLSNVVPKFGLYVKIIFLYIDLKSKVIKTKQNQFLYDRKEFIKKSAKRRQEKLKASYIQKIKSELNWFF